MARIPFVGVALGLAAVGFALGVPLPVHAKPYKGAEILSSQSYRYGRMEMRMRMARGSGLLSTFFTYKTGSEITGTFWEEIDIEVLGKDGAVAWQSNIITGMGTRTTSEQVHTNPFSLADDYHTYTLEWTPDYVAWKLDGVVVRQTSGGQVPTLTNPQSLRFNIWAANIPSWVGAFDDGSLPQYQYVNWIRYHRYEGGQFVLEWTDNFDSFDAARWARADWTFAENLADFDPNNVVVQNGTLVLALTREGQTGFRGTVPTDGGGNAGGAGGMAGSGGASVGGGGLGGGGVGGAGGTSVGGAGSGGSTSPSGGTTSSGGTSVGGAGQGGGGGMTGSGGGSVGGSSGVAGAGLAGGAAGGVPGNGGSAIGGSSGVGGVVVNGGDAGSADDQAVSSGDDAGCGCRLASRHPKNHAGPSLHWVLLALLVRRRKSTSAASGAAPTHAG